ncbi:MAG: helix-turn-helix domain-containing protein [Candidatus Tenebribacter davisii]|nr:helix-turn-helix domain-containing protein [Candidatus Tenebribacter davisii]
MKKYLNSQEAADLLCLSLSKLYKLTMSRQIPHKKVFSRLRFDPEQLILWLEENVIEINTEEALQKQAEKISQGRDHV